MSRTHDSPTRLMQRDRPTIRPFKPESQIHNKRSLVIIFQHLLIAKFTGVQFSRVRNSIGRDCNLSEHSLPCDVDPVQSVYRMTVKKRIKSKKRASTFFQLRNLWVNGTDLRAKALPYVGFKAPYDLNHKSHKEHKGKEIFLVYFVVPILQISQPVSTLIFTGILNLSQCH